MSSVIYPWREAPFVSFAVIGDPIAHSLSPVMQNAALAQLGLPADYCAIHVPDGEFEEAIAHLAGLGIRGLNVTLPHKVAAFRWAQATDDAAARIGAVNTLNLITGEARNTDLPGFRESVRHIPVGRAAVLGAGGSARAVLLALEELGFEMFLYNRTIERAFSLVSELGLRRTVVAASVSDLAFSLVVNCTSAGTQGERFELDFMTQAGPVHAVDLSYRRDGSLTPFLENGRNRGWSTQDGKAMLVFQGANSLEWWLGLEKSALQCLINPMAAAIAAVI